MRCALCLSSANMVNSPQECAQRFMILADPLFALKKISASVADNSKYQFDQFLKVAQYECKEEFLSFYFKEDGLDVFFPPFLAENESYNNLWAICKIIFILSHGQSLTEKGFSINCKVIEHNIQEKSLTPQRLVYDAIRNGGSQLSVFQITPALRKSCLLSCQRYKLDLEKKVNSVDLKRKIKHEIQKVKKQNMVLEATIKALKDGIIKEALLADDNQDLPSTVKAAVF